MKNKMCNVKPAPPSPKQQEKRNDYTTHAGAVEAEREQQLENESILCDRA
jgi:hypothetical protein